MPVTRREAGSQCVPVKTQGWWSGEMHCMKTSLVHHAVDSGLLEMHALKCSNSSDMLLDFGSATHDGQHSFLCASQAALLPT